MYMQFSRRSRRMPRQNNLCFRPKKNNLLVICGINHESAFSTTRLFPHFFSSTATIHGILLRNGYFSVQPTTEIEFDGLFRKQSRWSVIFRQKIRWRTKTRENVQNFKGTLLASRARSTAAVSVSGIGWMFHWIDGKYLNWVKHFKSPHLCVFKNCAPRFF